MGDADMSILFKETVAAIERRFSKAMSARIQKSGAVEFRELRRLGLGSAMLLGALSSSACLANEAKYLHVNNSGSPVCSDMTAKARNTAATPWCSIHRAVKGATFGGANNSKEAAASGDTVLITCGVYEADAKDEVFYVALNPVNSGLPDMPIRLQSKNATASCIRVRRRAGTGPGGSIIGSVQRSYVQWSGFDLRESDWEFAASTSYQNGLVLFHGDPLIYGGVIEDSSIRGAPAGDRSGDNYTGIRVHGASATIRNNTVSTFGRSGHNNTCSTWYFGASMLVEHNRFERCGVGLYVKNNAMLSAGESQHVIRYNWFEPNSTGIYLFENTNGTTANPVMVYQNVIWGGDENCIHSLWISTMQDAKHAKVFNNTCVGQDQSCFFVGGRPPPGAAFEMWNNICVGQNAIVLGAAGATAQDLLTSQIQWEHNVYFGFRVLAEWAGLGAISANAWRTRFRQDSVSPAAVMVDPLFVDSRAGNFRLSIRSPARMQGRAKLGVGGVDGASIPAGAYIVGTETIGPFRGAEKSP